jgi:hypothetical protein
MLAEYLGVREAKNKVGKIHKGCFIFCTFQQMRFVKLIKK